MISSCLRIKYQHLYKFQKCPFYLPPYLSSLCCHTHCCSQNDAFFSIPLSCPALSCLLAFLSLFTLRKRGCEWGRGRERNPSRLHAQFGAQGAQFHNSLTISQSHNHCLTTTRTWPEPIWRVRRFTDWATQVPPPGFCKSCFFYQYHCFVLSLFHEANFCTLYVQLQETYPDFYFLSTGYVPSYSTHYLSYTSIYWAAV